MLYEHACGSQRSTRGVQHANGMEEASHYETCRQDKKRHSGCGSDLHEAEDDYGQGRVFDEISVGTNPAAERLIIGIAMRDIQPGASEGYLKAEEDHHYGKDGGDACCNYQKGHFALLVT